MFIGHTPMPCYHHNARTKRERNISHRFSWDSWIALIHKSPTSCCGVSFPDLPGIVTAADNFDEALARAAEVLAFAFEDWQPPPPCGLDALRPHAEFLGWSDGEIVAAWRRVCWRGGKR
jgi:predicted RNase H-like HicB family nuclease